MTRGFFGAFALALILSAVPSDAFTGSTLPQPGLGRAHSVAVCGDWYGHCNGVPCPLDSKWPQGPMSECPLMATGTGLTLNCQAGTTLISGTSRSTITLQCTITAEMLQTLTLAIDGRLQ
jgi:hypothetical protein